MIRANAKRQPFILAADGNVNLAESLAIAAAVNAGLVVDIAHMFAPACTDNTTEETVPDGGP